jgi:hypothetical protein
MEDFTSKCNRCGGWIIIKLDGLYCTECSWFQPKRNPLEDLPEIRKTGEEFVAPHRLAHPSTKGKS